jgi:hypothetical protein
MQTKPVLLMPDDRHPADQAVTVPKKQRKSICILEEAFVGRISDGQVRHEARFYRVEVRDLLRQVVAATWLKLGAA